MPLLGWKFYNGSIMESATGSVMNDAYLLPAMFLLSLAGAFTGGSLWLPVILGVGLVVDTLVCLLRR